MAVERFLFDVEGHDVESLREALALSDELASRKSVEHVVLLVPVLGTLDGNVIQDAFGRKLAEGLMRNRRARLTNGGILEVETPRTWSRAPFPKGILALYPDKKILDLVDSVPGLEFAVVVPWVKEFVEEWRRAWNPTLPGHDQPAEEPLLSSEVLEAGLKMLTRGVNLSSGLAHPSDKDAAQSLLWELYRAGEWDAPDNVRAWALRNGWSPQGADALKHEAERTPKRRRPPTRRHYRSDVIDYLRSKIKSGEQE